MDGKRNSSLQSVTRKYEPHRLEEQVWAMAYEQIWPVLRRGLKRSRTAESASEPRSLETFATARRA
jgi:hypothetical protein